jgi:hypothetical protein
VGGIIGGVDITFCVVMKTSLIKLVFIKKIIQMHGQQNVTFVIARQANKYTDMRTSKLNRAGRTEQQGLQT